MNRELINRRLFLVATILLVVSLHPACQHAAVAGQPAIEQAVPDDSATVTMPAQSQPTGETTKASSNSAVESSYRYVYVIAPSTTDDPIRKATLRDVARSVGYQDKSDRFAVVVAGKDKPVVLPKNGLVVPDTDAKRALPELLESIKPVKKPDLLAAMKKAYDLHKTDARTARSATRRIYLYCPPDPPEEVVKLATDKHMWVYPQNRMRMFVEVTIIGTEFRGFANAIRIAALGRCCGDIELVDPDPAVKPTSTRVSLVTNRYRVAYVFDTRMTHEAMDRVRTVIRKSVSKLGHTNEFTMVAAGHDGPRVGPNEKFSEPNAMSEDGAAKFLQGLRPDANADLLAAVKRAYELNDTDKSFPNPLGTKQFLVYLICQSDPPKEVATFVAEKKAVNPGHRRVCIFMLAKEGTAHPNAARIAKATDGRVKIIPPEPATKPATTPAIARPGPSRPASPPGSAARQCSASTT